jgi:gliding motility-associated lipoprotein GldD
MNKINFTYLIIILFLSSFLALKSCKGRKNHIPKPPTYLKLELPPKNYNIYSDTICSISFKIPDYFKVKNIAKQTCNKDIDLGPHNGSLHLSYIKMDTSLAAYINYALDKIDEHKIKATAILDSTFIQPEQGTYGTLFELQGNVASPFHFYLTDSTDVFLSGVVYFNTRPNYDSIRPVLNYVKKDLILFMQTVKW